MLLRELPLTLHGAHARVVSQAPRLRPPQSPHQHGVGLELKGLVQPSSLLVSARLEAASTHSPCFLLPQVRHRMTALGATLKSDVGHGR